MASSTDEGDGNALVLLKQFRSASETELVIGLLRGSGIPTVLAGRYNPKAPMQILVPSKCVADANRVLADRGDVAPRPISTAERFGDGPRSILTAITWLLALGISGLVVLAVGRFVFATAKSLFR